MPLGFVFAPEAFLEMETAVEGSAKYCDWSTLDSSKSLHVDAVLNISWRCPMTALKGFYFSLSRNPSKSYLRHTIPTVDRGTGLLESPTIFNLSADRLINGVRSPQTRQPGQNRTRMQSTTSYIKRDVGSGRVESTASDSSPSLGRGRWVLKFRVKH